MDFENHYHLKIVTLFALFLTSPFVAAAGEWSLQSAEVCKSLNKILPLVAQSQIKESKSRLDDAYFEDFENIKINLEVAIRTHISSARAAELESQFAEIRKRISKAAPIDEIKLGLNILCAEIKKDALQLDENKVKP